MRNSNEYGDHDGSFAEIEADMRALRGTCDGPDDPLCGGADCICQDEVYDDD